MKIKFLALAFGTALYITIQQTATTHNLPWAIVTALSSRQFDPLIQLLLLNFFMASVALAIGVFAAGLHYSIKGLEMGENTFQVLLLASFLSVFPIYLLAPFCGNLEIPNAFLVLINCLLTSIGLLLAIKNIWSSG